MICMPYGLKSLHEIATSPSNSWSHAHYLAGLVPLPWRRLGFQTIKPRVRVKMGRNVVTLRAVRNQCRRKAIYGTMQQAFDAMMMNHGKRPEYNIYECPHCQKWHVGHRGRVAA